jgi:hypothetical protein
LGAPSGSAVNGFTGTLLSRPELARGVPFFFIATGFAGGNPLQWGGRFFIGEAQFFFGGNYVAWNKNKGNSVDFLVETPPLFFLAPFFFITGFFPLPSHLLMGGGEKTAQIGKKTNDCAGGLPRNHGKKTTLRQTTPILDRRASS